MSPHGRGIRVRWQVLSGYETEEKGDKGIGQGREVEEESRKDGFGSLRGSHGMWPEEKFHVTKSPNLSLEDLKAPEYAWLDRKPFNGGSSRC